MNCGAHELICGPPLDEKVCEKTENLQSDKGQGNFNNPVEANRGNCGVMGVNFGVGKSNKRMPDGQISTSSSAIYVILTENSQTVNPEEE